jgi:hypothetical protein
MGHQFQLKNVKGSAALQTTATSGLHFWMSALHRARIKTHVIIINAQKVEMQRHVCDFSPTAVN